MIQKDPEVKLFKKKEVYLSREYVFTYSLF